MIEFGTIVLAPSYIWYCSGPRPRSCLTPLTYTSTKSGLAPCAVKRNTFFSIAVSTPTTIEKAASNR